MLFPGQNKDNGPKEMSLQDILRTINLDFQYSQMSRPPTKDEISMALDLLNPRKVDAAREQYGNKLYYELSKYMTTDINTVDNPRIIEAVQFVQGKLIDRTDLLALNDGSISLAASLVLEASGGMLDGILARPQVLKLPTMYGDVTQKVMHGIVLDKKLSVAHLIAMLAEKGDERMDEQRLGRLIDAHLVLGLRNSKGESVSDIIERTAVKWKDDKIIESIKKAKPSASSSQDDGSIAKIREKHGESMARLVASFSDDPDMQRRIVARLEELQ
ncbi:MAG: hypothetical protein ACREBH_01960 [Candidatus Micrarchaeaceae archaeon]